MPRSQRAAASGLQEQEGGTCSGGSREEEAEKNPDEIKATVKGWKKGHGQRF